MIWREPAVDVPCGVCGEMVREWGEDGLLRDDPVARPCGHTLMQHYHKWVERLKQKR